MKFNYIIIVLLLIIVKVLSQDITKCQATTEKYSNCVSSFHAESFETKCETFSSALCQQLFKSPKTILKDCDEEFIEITSAVLKDMNNILQYTCYKDEEGEYCPLSKIIQETEIHPDIYEKQKFSEIFENIKESCSSERCLKISISYMESIKSIEFDPSNISEVLSNNDESDSTVLITALDHNQNDQFGSLNDGDGDGAGAGAGDVVTNNAVDPTNALNNDGYINDDIGIKTSLENTTYNNTISENNINVVPDQSGSPQRIILSYSFSIILLSLILYI
ncbi:hypothetical protein H8356DRAFT_1314641 [Neocallimastix lanati (nom. inval.)]|nr:hypothetical protein H8356DRAFT_1314641 [Neocallimastix sp. JGI-2020a]